jgi:hypothetical protein
MPVATAKPPSAPAIRPFTIETPEADLEELRSRITATRWPEKETVADQSQGVQLATIQKLARYWATGYGSSQFAFLQCQTRLHPGCRERLS